MPVDQKIITSTLLRDRARLLAYIGAIVRDHHIAEDVLQEVSMLAMEKHETIRDEEVLPGWLRVTARFRSLKALEKRNRLPALMDSEMLDLMEPQWQQADQLAIQETHKAMHECVDKLAPNAQKLIELRYGAGLTVKEIAHKFNRKADTLYKNFGRIHTALARCIRKAGGA